MILDDAECGLQHRKPLACGSFRVHLTDRFHTRAPPQTPDPLPERAGGEIQRQCDEGGERHHCTRSTPRQRDGRGRSEEHTSELQSPCNLVCRLLLEKKKMTNSSRMSLAVRTNSVPRPIQSLM